MSLMEKGVEQILIIEPRSEEFVSLTSTVKCLLLTVIDSLRRLGWFQKLYCTEEKLEFAQKCTKE